MGGVTFVPLRRSNRETAGVAGGDTIEVTLTLDTAPRTVTPPTDLVAAIHAAGLEAAWAKQSYTRQREADAAVEGANKPETRARQTKERGRAPCRDKECHQLSISEGDGT